MAYSPDGETLAIGGDGYVRSIDARSRRQVADAFVYGVATDLAFTNDGSRLVVVHSEGVGGVGPAWITILDSSTLQQAGSIYPEGFEARWVSQERAVPRIALAADDSLITASSEKGELVWWDLDTGRKEKTLEIDHGYGGYRALGRSPDGRTVAVGLSRGFGLVDVRTGAVRRARGARAFPIALVFSPDGGTVVSTNVDGTVAVWDAETRRWSTPAATLGRCGRAYSARTGRRSTPPVPTGRPLPGPRAGRRDSCGGSSRSRTTEGSTTGRTYTLGGSVRTA